MLSLSHTTGYAVLALGCIESGQGQWVLSRNIHTCTGIPMPYLRKILFALGKSGLIRAKRGREGGFLLKRPASRISLMDVVEAVEHGKSVPDCLLGLPGCSDATPCPLRSFWQKERARIEARLRRVTVRKAAEFVRAARGGKLTTCPPAEETPRRGRQAPTTRSAGRKGSSKTSTRKTSTRKKARATQRKRS